MCMLDVKVGCEKCGFIDTYDLKCLPLDVVELTESCKLSACPAQTSIIFHYAANLSLVYRCSAFDVKLVGNFSEGTQFLSSSGGNAP